MRRSFADVLVLSTGVMVVALSLLFAFLRVHH
jgi:hypothetical protein